MFLHITWSSYWAAALGITAAYYVCLGIIYMSRVKRANRDTTRDAPGERIHVPREPWMDEVLTALEETIRHAERKRYHPDEIIKALQIKMDELKEKL